MKRGPLTYERLKEVLDYNPETGAFVWVGGFSPYVGKEAGCVAKRETGHRTRTIGIDGYRYAASHLAWLFVNGSWPDGALTYKDEDRLNVRIENLLPIEKATYSHETAHGVQKRGSLYYKEYRKRRYEAMKGNVLKYRMGISIDEYNRILLSQNGVCATCKNPELVSQNGKIRSLSVDHDHKTDSIRGLLCYACNVGIGFFKDDPERLRRAAEYLEQHVVTPQNVIQISGRKRS